jgi:hypothetical protein
MVDREQFTYEQARFKRMYALIRIAVVITVAFAMVVGVGACAVGPQYDAVAFAPKKPPDARPEVRPKRPGHRYVWRAGHWRWVPRVTRYVWRPGKWLRVRHPHHRIWVQGHWAKRSQGYYWVTGHWR